MLKILQEYLSVTFVSAALRQEPPSLPLACAVLMFEILRADREQHPAEWETVRRHITQAFSLDEKAAEDLMQAAKQHAEEAISLHAFVREINQAYEPEAKAALVRMLWDVAYADGQLDPHEEYAIRKLADLLYVRHRDFIRGKHQAMPSED